MSLTTLGVIGVAVVIVMALAIALVTSLAERLRERAVLDELFEQAPQAVALMDADSRIVRVNREFTRLFGFAPAEVVGRSIDEVIGCDQSHEEAPDFVHPGAGKERRERESMRRCKNGALLLVSTLRAPVQIPGGQIEIYGIFRDVSERKVDEMPQTSSHQLIEAQEAERRRVARELHDEIGQTLTAIRLNLNSAQHSEAAALAQWLEDSIVLADQALQQVRDLSLDLRPSLLDEFGLVSALRWYLEREAERAGLNAELIGEAPPPDRVPPALETACFRVAQEAITNVVRHARAKNVRVELRERNGELQLVIEDDGVGFDLDEVRKRSATDARLGLLGMYERATILGGKLVIDSGPRGTTVDARFPLP